MKFARIVIPILFVAPSANARTQIPKPAQCLIDAYPKTICGFENEKLLWCDGTTSPWDRETRPDETFFDHLAKPSLALQMSIRYPKEFVPPSGENDDPGRIRHDPFFKKMYGASKKEVAKNTRIVKWPLSGQKLRVTTINGVDKKLETIGAEVAKLPIDIRKVVKKSSGGFVWRNIKGTNRMSAHSFGVAVDVGVENSNYWKWSKPNKAGKYPYKNRIPREVVEIFERHGFIWGGKWYHYDTMHFEYRPELLACSD